MILAWLSFAALLSAGQDAELVDPASRVGFSLQTRWGQVLQGRFPVVEGEVELRPDGQRVTRMRLDARALEIVGRARYTDFARGPTFFDAQRHPVVEFVSEPHDAARLRAGGPIAGELRIRGIARRERFVLEPSRCARPGLDCDIVARGTVLRARYGMDGWRMAVRPQVQFDLRMRTRLAGDVR